ncbi:MAG: YlmH/Sll1252 family protein [Erysipelotrichales bacterium]
MVKLAIVKSNLDKLILHYKQYESLIRRVEDAINYSLQFNSFKFIYFVDAMQQQVIEDTINHFEGVKVSFQSQIINSEKKYALIYCDFYDANQLQGSILYTLNYNSKFNHVSHRDVLGSLMNLGIDRNLVGDIFVDDKKIYFEIADSLEKYIEENLDKIKKVNVKLKKVDYTVERIQEYTEYSGIVKSFRIDGIVSAITKKSRSEVKDMILGNNIKVNQIEVQNFALECKDNDILSIKGYGRFRLVLKNNNKTKKGNIHFTFLKYI